jgi:hypothetical protein
VGLEVAEYLTVDDTGARHQGQSGYTTQLGTEQFAWFESTPPKDRISFLSVPQGGAPSCVINAQALQYMEEQKSEGAAGAVEEFYGACLFTKCDLSFSRI